MQYPITRRRWAVMVSGAAIAAVGGAEIFRSRHREADGDPLRDGSFAGVVPFQDEGSAPLDTVTGDELDGRLYTDLTYLDRGNMEIPTDRFYVRTRASHLLNHGPAWSIRLPGAGRVTMEQLAAQASPQGLHLMECAGNTRGVRFGMIGVAAWDGVPLERLLDSRSFDRNTRVLVSGFDDYSAKPLAPSIPGASWIFSRQDIEDSGAFLATRMNGQRLTADHGAPVRLVLPGWYGCACIKWVNEVGTVKDSAAPTSQMAEYAARTHQHGMPALASEYQPALIDPAAMPVRVEKWIVGNTAKFKVAGIVWGGTGPVGKLLIRFGPDEPYVPVWRAQAAGPNPWGLWTHIWTPRRPGIYRIRLRLGDASIRTRRLDTGYYVRQVRLDSV